MEATLSLTKESGTGRFRIRGWSLLQHKKNDKVSSGKIMEVGGAQWALEVWPKGAESSTDGWIRFALACSSPPDKALPRNGLRSTYSLTVVNQHGGENMTKETGSGCCVFKNGEGWGWDDFMKISVLEKGFVLNDEVIFEGSVTVVGNEVVSKAALPSSQVSSSPCEDDLVQDLRKLLASGERTDVVLRTCDEDLPAHTVILAARSPVFAGMLNSKMREAATGVVDVNDVDASTLRHLLEFIYTGTIEADGLWEDAEACGFLLQAAVKYEITGLVKLCARKVAGMITVDNAAEWLVLATRVGQQTEALKEQCLQFIAGHLSDVQGTEGWQRLMKDAMLIKEVAPMLFQAISPPPSKKARTGKQ